jgi:hypothetical protein
MQPPSGARLPKPAPPPTASGASSGGGTSSGKTSGGMTSGGGGGGSSGGSAARRAPISYKAAAVATVDPARPSAVVLDGSDRTLGIVRPAGEAGDTTWPTCIVPDNPRLVYPVCCMSLCKGRDDEQVCRWCRLGQRSVPAGVSPSTCKASRVLHMS